MIIGINHVGISVSSLDRAIGFYGNLLGMEVVVRKDFEGEQYSTILGLKNARGEVALLRHGDFQVELFAFEHPSPQPGDRNRPVCDHGITHLCVQVTDIEGEYARLKAAGVVFHCPPQYFFGTAIATYGRDPDGNVFEMLEMLSPDEPQKAPMD